MIKYPTFRVVWNWRNCSRPSKAYPVHICIYIPGQPRKYFPIKIIGNVTAKQWSGAEKAWISNTHPCAFEANHDIEEKMNRLSRLRKRHMLERKPLDMRRIYRELKMDSDPELFNNFYEQILKDPPESMTDANLKRYYSALSSLNKYNPKVAFYEVNEEFFQRLKKHQKEVQELDASTIRGYFNAYSKILKWSRYDAHMSKEQAKDALQDINHRGANKRNKDFLDLHEVLQWQDYVFPDKYAHYESDRDMFLLLVYTGYYYNDLKTLLKTELRLDADYGYYLYSERFKNNNLAIVPIWKFPRAMQLIRKYIDLNPDSPYLLRRDAFIEDQPFNRNLKVIAGPKMLDWKRRIYNKLGRKTNTQLYIRYGAGRPQMSKILGHESEASTQAYYDINLAEIIEGVRNVDFMRLGLGTALPALDRVGATIDSGKVQPEPGMAQLPPPIGSAAQPKDGRLRGARQQTPEDIDVVSDPPASAS